MGIPEKCWRGCWHKCWQKKGGGKLLCLCFPKGPTCQHLCQHSVKIIVTTPTRHISKKYDPKICHKIRGRMAYKSLEMKGLSQRMWCTNRLLWHTNSDFYGIRTPPFMPYEPFLLGVGVVFNFGCSKLEPFCETKFG